jgi:cytochrome c oxidase subunit 4
MEGRNTAEAGAREPGVFTYVIVWAALIILTGLTVTAASLNVGRPGIMICLVIAVVKSTIVLLYFMHLRYEKRLLIKLFIPIALAVLAIFIGLTYTDVMAR